MLNPSVPHRHCAAPPPSLPRADALLQREALRPVSLVAQDLASLAIALCARGEDMAGAWRALAAECDDRVDEDASLTQGADAYWCLQRRPGAARTRRALH